MVTRPLRPFPLSAAALLALLACKPPPPPGQRSLTAVKVHAVERASAATSARYSANIEPSTRVDLAFKVSGYIEAITRTRGADGASRPLQEGDKVAAGALLASVRKADYAQRLGEAKAALAEAVAAKEQAVLDYGRAKTLSEAGSLPAQQLDAARVRVDSAGAREDGSRSRLEEAQTALADTELRSPLDGVLTKRFIEVGALAAPGTVAFSVADTRSMKVVFGVPDTVLESLHLGATQTVTTEAFRGREFSGRISRISPVADPKSRVFEVEVSIPNPKGELRAGMVASLKLDSAAAQGLAVAVLPLSAVVRAPGKPGRFAVAVLDEKATPPVVHLREVELGEFLGNKIPIKSGLSEGEKVVVLGAPLLADAEAVQVIP
jgi:multidrug efflux system membrane fusion protein